ncbi:hypothetical protein GIW29_22455, partial [Pseudomonas sp. PA-5-4B]|nr:hypothetical protein [Pseudomonas sp. PA-5-4B]
MVDYSSWGSLLILIALTVLLDSKLKHPELRKWFGLALILTGPMLLIVATSWLSELQFDSLPTFAFIIGIRLFFTRNKFRRQRNPPPHP